MNKFRNFALQRYHKDLLKNLVDLNKGEVGGYSIEIETREPTSFDSYVYNGKFAKNDREFDFNLLKRLLKTSTQ